MAFGKPQVGFGKRLTGKNLQEGMFSVFTDAQLQARRIHPLGGEELPIAVNWINRGIEEYSRQQVEQQGINRHHVFQADVHIPLDTLEDVAKKMSTTRRELVQPESTWFVFPNVYGDKEWQEVRVLQTTLTTATVIKIKMYVPKFIQGDTDGIAGANLNQTKSNKGATIRKSPLKRIRF